MYRVPSFIKSQRVHTRNFISLFSKFSTQSNVDHQKNDALEFQSEEEIAKAIREHYENNHIPLALQKYRRPGPPYTDVSKIEKIPLFRDVKPVTLRDKIAKSLLKIFRFVAHKIFGKDHLQQALVLESIAVIPGLVAATARTLTSCRKMQHDNGWIGVLTEESENERMHLLTWRAFRNPTLVDKIYITIAQFSFFILYSVIYMVSPSMGFRLVGYLEEEALHSFCAFIKAIDDGEIPNPSAPEFVRNYWNLPPDAKLRDVIICIRADEMNHRDMNHEFADRRYKGTPL